MIVWCHHHHHHNHSRGHGQRCCNWFSFSFSSWFLFGFSFLFFSVLFFSFVTKASSAATQTSQIQRIQQKPRRVHLDTTFMVTPRRYITPFSPSPNMDHQQSTPPGCKATIKRLDTATFRAKMSCIVPSMARIQHHLHKHEPSLFAHRPLKRSNRSWSRLALATAPH